MNKKKPLSGFLLIFVLLLFSCGKRPSYVLNEDKMVSLMVDMEIAEAYSNSFGGRRSEEKIELGRRVMAKHGVTPEQLDTTLAWYGKNLDDYSALFDKVDKELNRRRKKYVDMEDDINGNVDNLWPFATHQILMPQSGYEALIISLRDPSLDAGDKLKLSFSLPNPAGIKGLLGVDYSDGTSETTTTTFNNKSKIELEFQTDTAKKVSRIFGVMSLKDKKDRPLFIDSILIAKLPLDSLDYRQKKRIQKKYGIVMPKPKIVNLKDSIETDSIPIERQTETLVKDTIQRDSRLEKEINRTKLKRAPQVGSSN